MQLNTNSYFHCNMYLLWIEPYLSLLLISVSRYHLYVYIYIHICINHHILPASLHLERTEFWAVWLILAPAGGANGTAPGKRGKRSEEKSGSDDFSVRAVL